MRKATRVAYPLHFKPTRNARTAWLERINPLMGLSIRQAQNIYDCARMGNYALLQFIYSEIEAADPVLMICVERRTSALAGLGWRAVANQGAGDDALAEAQRQFIEDAASKIDNLSEAIEHLGGAFFRGFAHLAPVRDETGAIVHLEMPNSWNFCKDNETGAWLWNPEAICAGAASAGFDMQPIPPEELVTIERRRAIDYPALAVYIRHALAERNWGRFLERYGIPPCILIMPELSDPNMSAKFQQAAQDAYEGRNGALPNGSDVKFATEARGANPFSAFVEHQQKLVVLMSTGGTLASLAESGAGTLAGNAQQDVWDEIVQRDGKIVGNALNRQMFRPMLERAFPGKGILAGFELGQDSEPSPAELFDIAAKARSAGYLIDQAQLEEASGYKLAPDSSGAGGNFGGFALNRAPAAGVAGATPLQNAGEPLQNARSNRDGSTPAPAADAPEAILGAFARDIGPAAEKVKKFLAGGMSKEEAAALAAELPGMLPKDPAMAAVIADAMAEAMAAESGNQPADHAEDTEKEPVANSGTSEGARKGWETRRKNGWTTQQYEDAQNKINGLIDKLDLKGPGGKGKGWNGNDEESFSEVDPRTMADIRKANPKMTEGKYDSVVSVKQLHHALERHGIGKEQDPDSIPITKDDLRRIPDILSDYDSIEPASGKEEGKRTEAILIKKSYPDGTIVVVELDYSANPSKSPNRRLYFQTMWKEKNR